MFFVFIFSAAGSKLKYISINNIQAVPHKFIVEIIRLPRELEKCQISQDISHMSKRLERRNTLCISSERLKDRHEIDKEDGAS